MASIVTRKNKFAVVYSIKDENGVSRQKWETFDTKTDAKKRKAEVEHLINTNSFIAPSAKTVRDLLTEYVDLYGISKWAMSTYDGNLSLMNNYILPGHSQASMVTERYAHILDADRKRNAERVEEEFYGNGVGGGQQSNLSLPEGISESDQQLVMSLLTNPQALALLKNLAKAL